MNLNTQLQHGLSELLDVGMLRELELPNGIDFCSNDYLGHSRHPLILQAAHLAMQQFGVGAPAARLLRGQLAPHADVELAAAEWQKTEASLLFPSGYQANLALMSALPQPGDVILSDELNHASLIDGCRLSHAQRKIFAHNDLIELGELLENLGNIPGRKWIVTERVFSMDGDQAPIRQILQLCDKFDAYLMLDEAHSAALYPVLPAHPRLVTRMITGGKALGVGGALVCASKAVVQTLINKARSFIFTTANQPASAAALAQSIRLCQQQPERIAMVHRNAQRLRAALMTADLELRGEGPIVPVILGSTKRASSVAKQLQDAGFDVRAIRPPTVPQGSSRIRLVVHAHHTPEQIDALASAVIAGVTGATHPNLDPSPVKKAIVICGTDTNVGKTVLSALMLNQVRRTGAIAAYLKPVQTGSDSDTETVRELAALSVEQVPDPVMEFDLPASIDQAAEFEQRSVQAEQVAVGVSDILAQNDQAQWILECAGGLMVPLNHQQSQADYVQALGFPVILAARSALGTLNHTLLTVEALRMRGIPLLGVALIGGKHPGNFKSLRGILKDVPIVEVPHFDRLNYARLQDWVEQGHLDCLLPCSRPLTVCEA